MCTSTMMLFEHRWMPPRYVAIAVTYVKVWMRSREEKSLRDKMICSVRAELILLSLLIDLAGQAHAFLRNAKG